MTNMDELITKAMRNMQERFVDNPCRGIVLGMNGHGIPMQLSWIMGRHSNSQNRDYVVEDEPDIPGQKLIRAEPFDAGKVEDPSNIIYTAMRCAVYENGTIGCYVVSNGKQTDTAVHMLNFTDVTFAHETFLGAMSEWHCEDDFPNFTARITGLTVATNHGSQFYMSLLKACPIARARWKDAIAETGWSVDYFLEKAEGDKTRAKKMFLAEMETRTGLCTSAFPTQRNMFGLNVKPGLGYCLTTYMPGSQSLDSFEGEPFIVPVHGTLEEVMGTFWEALNPKWRVSLGGREITSPGESRYAEPINVNKRAG